MTEQTYLLSLQDCDGMQKDFERFACKKLDTVIKQYSEHMKRMQECRWYMRDIETVTHIRIYRTDYQTTPENMVYEIQFSEFMKTIA